TRTATSTRCSSYPRDRWRFRPLFLHRPRRCSLLRLWPRPLHRRHRHRWLYGGLCQQPRLVTPPSPRPGPPTSRRRVPPAGGANLAGLSRRVGSRPSMRVLGGEPRAAVRARGRGRIEPGAMPYDLPSAARHRLTSQRHEGRISAQDLDRPRLNRGNRLSSAHDADERGTGSLPLRWAAGLPLLIAAVALLARRLRRGSVASDTAPIIAGNVALLPDNADLLRELDPAHRARVHDDCSGRPRPPSRAARRRDVLPHRDGRERLEER